MQLTILEMPPIEQLLHTNVDHLSIGYGADPSPEPDLERSEPALHGCIGVYAQAHGKHQELRRVPRYPASSEPALHTLLW
jgi:hypothetical protein